MKLVTLKSIETALNHTVQSTFLPCLDRPEVNQAYADMAATLPGIRERHRHAVDAILDAALSCTAGSALPLLRGTDPILLALVWDRILAAQHTLGRMAEKHPVAPLPVAPEAFVHMLLLQRLSGVA
jgi:hypothetical protein